MAEFPMALQRICRRVVAEGSRHQQAAVLGCSNINKGSFVKTLSTVMIVVGLSCGAMPAFAADFGIGVSVQSDDALIYLPIDFNKQFRLEPSIRYLKDEQDFGNGVNFDQESIEIGVGLFGLTGVGESIRVYYGGRLAYVRNEVDQTTQLVTGPVFGTIVLATRQSDADGYRISPTLGFEYLINERLSIGAEAEYFFQDVEGDDLAADRETSGTDTRLIVRFKF
jgi:hypothetical protein